MGFTGDLWTALLSGDEDEVVAAVARLGADEVGAAIAESALPPSKTPAPAPNGLRQPPDTSADQGDA